MRWWGLVVIAAAAVGCGAECGDGKISGVEECDDGNRDADDGCNQVCHTEFCGDRTIQAGEQCDDGNTVNNDGCDAFCKFEDDPSTSAT